MISPATIGVADGIKEPMVVNCGYQLLSEECQQYATNTGQVEVVEDEGQFQLEGWPIAHQFPTPKDDHVIHDNE